MEKGFTCNEACLIARYRSRVGLIGMSPGIVIAGFGPRWVYI